MFFLPKLENLQRTVKTESKFQGLDTRPGASESSLSDCDHISPSMFPALSVCNPLQTYLTISGIDYDIMSPGEDEMLEIMKESVVKIKRHYIWLNGVPVTREIELLPGEELIASSYLYSDLILMVRSGEVIHLQRYDHNCSMVENISMTNLLGSPVNGTLRMFSFNGRLVILHNEQVHIGYLGSMNQWTEYLPETPAYLGSAAQNFQFHNITFTGGIFFRSRPVLFGKSEMYQLYNETKPFSPIKTVDIGCINPRSIAICDGILCFLSSNGVMAYNGSGLPFKISEKLPELPVIAANSGACAYGDCYYIGGYVYCFGTKEWTKLRDVPEGAEISAMCRHNNMVYLLEKSATGAVLYQYSPDQAKTSLKPAWSFTTQEFHEKEPGKKKLTQLAFRVEPKQESTLRVEISIDGRDWYTLCQRTLKKNGSEELRIKTPPGENFRLRFSGTGKLAIPYIRRVYHLLSDGKIHPFL